MIAELNIAKALESTWEDLAMTMHAHPTLSEAVMEVLWMLLDLRFINKNGPKRKSENTYPRSRV